MTNLSNRRNRLTDYFFFLHPDRIFYIRGERLMTGRTMTEFGLVETDFLLLMTFDTGLMHGVPV